MFGRVISVSILLYNIQKSDAFYLCIVLITDATEMTELNSAGDLLTFASATSFLLLLEYCTVELGLLLMMRLRTVSALRAISRQNGPTPMKAKFIQMQ